MKHYVIVPCWSIQGQLYLPMLVQIIKRLHIKWRQSILSLRMGFVNHSGDSSRVVQYGVSLVAKVDLWSYSFCHPSIHNLPRFSVNSTFPSWLEVGRSHFLFMTYHWSFCWHKTLVNSVDDIKSKVQLRINSVNMWKLIWHSILTSRFLKWVKWMFW